MTPTEVAELSEEEARAQFRHWRFLENGGEPYCNRCGCVATYTFKDGKLFKCKGCLKQFTLTTNTPFAYRKLSFKTIMLALAQFAVAYQGRSAREILRDLRKKVKHYKTIFVWLHKIRLALKKHEQSRTLSGEVEIDGKEMGGYIRPKNKRQETKAEKTQKNFWKFPFKASDRKLWVTVARARTGATRSWVCREEEHAVPLFKETLENDAVVYSDQGDWIDIRGTFALRQVNHTQHFYTPESCTNHAESAHNALGTMERIHRHITGRYLDAYSAQLAWRMTCVSRDQDANFADLMGAIMAAGRSPMTGYFLPRSKGGQKRQCEIVNPDGSIGLWSPPPREERRTARAQISRRDRHARLDSARSTSWAEDFSFVSAAEFLSAPKSVPTSPGVYALFLRSGDQLLDSVGYEPERDLAKWKVDGRTHLYTGESFGLRQRVTQHLLGDVEDSTFRGSVLSLYWEAGLRRGEQPEFGDREVTEKALTDWLADEVTIGFKVCGYTREHQDALLRRTASPLNITDRPKTEFSRRLVEWRRRFSEVTESWGPTPPKVRKKHRR